MNRSIQPADGQSYTLGHSFGTAVDDGKPITIGWSGAGKVWSNTSHRIPDLLEWCEKLATRFGSTDEVLTGSELDYFRTGKSVTTIPDGPISVEWDEEVYGQDMYIRYVDESGIQRQTALLDTELQIDHDTPGATKLCLRLIGAGLNLPVEFCLARDNWFSLPEADPHGVEIHRGRQRLSLLDYLNSHPPMFYFWDYSCLIRDTYYSTSASSWQPFLAEWIEVIDWDAHNVDVSSEVSPGKAGKLSVHAHTEARIRADGCSMVFFDHLAPEYADFIAVKEEPNYVQFSLYHCKSTKEGEAASRVKEIYEVAGQVEKSIHWGNRPAMLRARMADRGGKRSDRFLKGDLAEMDRLIEACRRKRTRFRIVVVHPGLSQSALTMEVGGVLGAADSYLSRLGYERLEILGSH